MVKPPKNLTALDGKDATIACKAQGAPAPNITWFVNGKTSFLGYFQMIIHDDIFVRLKLYDVKK